MDTVINSTSTLYGACRRAGYCIEDCGLCKFIKPYQKPAYKASNQAARYKTKKTKGMLLGPDAPGRQIGYKEPLRPVEDGYGFMGTLTVDESETMVQCHDCGFYFKNLGQHLREHNITQGDYKRKYGLFVSMPLLTGNSLQEWKEMRPYNYTKQHREQARRAQLLATEATKKSTLTGKSSIPLEWYNRFGICPDQVLDKYLHFKNELGRHASYRETKAKFNAGTPRLIMKALDCEFWSDVCDRIDELENELLRSESIGHEDIKLLKTNPKSRNR